MSFKLDELNNFLQQTRKIKMYMSWKQIPHNTKNQIDLPFKDINCIMDLIISCANTQKKLRNSTAFSPENVFNLDLLKPYIMPDIINGVKNELSV